MNLSIIVPCHIRHLKYIKNIIIGNISKQTFKPDELIFVINPVHNSYQKHVVEHIFDDVRRKYDFVKYFNVADECMPGKARNIGFGHSSGDIIIYSDADDLYHPMRNEIIAKTFEDHDCDIVLHSYHLKEKDNIFKEINYESIVIDRCATDPTSQTGVKPENKSFLIAQGHASFKRNILEKIKYEETFVPGEDGEILRRAHKENKKIICINSKLSSWFPTGGWHKAQK